MNFSFLIPIRIRKAILKVHHNIVWRKAILEFERLIKSNSNVSIDLLRRLVYGWGNQGFSAQVNYLQTCIKYGLDCQKPILECGSGLTTVLLSIIAAKNNIKLITLENSTEWADKVKKNLSTVSLKDVSMSVTPLKDYNDFSWYDVSRINHRGQYGLIICDGPPAQTNGGRYGLVPIMKQFINSGSIILMDDTIRKGELSIINKWKDIISFDVEYKQEGDHHAILRVTS